MSGRRGGEGTAAPREGAAPRFPKREEYGPEEGAERGPRIRWEQVSERLAGEPYYWLVTVRPDGRPHAVAVWAVWVEDLLWFTTSPETTVSRNLGADARALVHLESAANVVIVEGAAERPDPRDVPHVVVEAYHAKYGWRLDPADSGMPYWVVRPEVVLAWSSADLRGTAARWRFA